MSDVHPGKVGDVVDSIVIKSDCDFEMKIEKDKHDVNNKSRSNKDDEISMTKKSDNAKKKKPGPEVLKSDKNSDAAVVNNDVINGHDDRHGVPSNEANSTSGKRENNGERNAPAQKGEKATRKKKTQKENSHSNGNVKEDGEKKKKKKKKKKKGGGGDDELKSAKEAEATVTAAKSCKDKKIIVDKSDEDILLKIPLTKGEIIIEDPVDSKNGHSTTTNETPPINRSNDKIINQELHKENKSHINNLDNMEIQGSLDQTGIANTIESETNKICKEPQRSKAAEKNKARKKVVQLNNEQNLDKNEQIVNVKSSVERPKHPDESVEELVQAPEDSVNNLNNLNNDADNTVIETEVNSVHCTKILIQKAKNSNDCLENLVDAISLSEASTKNSENGTENSDVGTKNSEVGTKKSEVDIKNSDCRAGNSNIDAENSHDCKDISVDGADTLVLGAENLDKREEILVDDAKNIDNSAQELDNVIIQNKEAFIKNDSCFVEATTTSKYRNDAEETANFLDTILESDEVSSVNQEDITNEHTFSEDESSSEVNDNDKSKRQRSKDDKEEDTKGLEDDTDKFYTDKDQENTDKTDKDIDEAVDMKAKKDGSGNSVLHMSTEELQRQLQEQQAAMDRLQRFTHEQQVKSNLLTTSLRVKLRRKEQELKLAQSEHEQQVSAVLSILLHLEGKIQKENKEMCEVLIEKNDIIRRQKAAIEDLSAKNHDYLKTLRESHGYTTDNGLVKMPNYFVVEQNENISIQDHGNKVILRGHKNKNGEKLQFFSHKVRFSAMKDRLRRHKSSLELYQPQPLDTLKEASVKFGSEENLVVHRNSKVSVQDRKERCRSLIECPAYLFDVEEGQAENGENCFNDDFSSPIIPRHDSTSSLVTLNESNSRSNGQLSSVYGFNELSKSRSVPHALPTVVENDGSPTVLRGRPHSLPSVEMLAKEIAASTTSSKSVSASTSKSPLPPSTNTASSSLPSDSNPFKTFKNVFKRKGSSKKKRAAAVTSGQEQTDVLKQHFKKYDMT